MATYTLKNNEIINDNPKVVIQVGNYHGLIFIDYSEDGKYEDRIILNLFSENKDDLCFYAIMNFNNSKNVESIYGHYSLSSRSVKKMIGHIPFYELADKLETFMPISLSVFMELVRDTLKNNYSIEGKIAHYNISVKLLEQYYAKPDRTEDLYSFESLLDYFYVSKSVFNCMVNKSEELIIDDYNFTEFPEIILSFVWVKKLELYELLISDIPDELTSLIQLTSLSIKLKFLKRLPQSISRLNNLEVLKIERTSISELGDGVFELSSLKELHIINNNELAEIPANLGNLKNLEYLYIYNNRIKSLPQTIAELINLRVLYIADNIIEELPDEITSLPTLKVINISGNKLKKIPLDLFEMNCIEEINLSNNTMIDKGMVYDLIMKSVRRDKIKLVL
jgi:Leucine-rich repeat (LRR) protein